MSVAYVRAKHAGRSSLAACVIRGMASADADRAPEPARTLHLRPLSYAPAGRSNSHTYGRKIDQEDDLQLTRRYKM
jgi:hypothetical protein